MCWDESAKIQEVGNILDGRALYKRDIAHGEAKVVELNLFFTAHFEVHTKAQTRVTAEIFLQGCAVHSPHCDILLEGRFKTLLLAFCDELTIADVR